MNINKDIAIMAESSVYCSLVNTDPTVSPFVNLNLTGPVV